MKAVLAALVLLALARGGSAAAGGAATKFVFPGFAGDNLTTSGTAVVTASGLLQLTNETNEVFGHGFYPAPLRFKNASTGAPLSFSTTFVAAILPRYPDARGHGVAFALAPSATVPGAVAGKNLGLFNTSTDLGDARSGIVAVELDTAWDKELSDINDNHVGVDVNSIKSKSNCSKPAGYIDAAGTGKPTNTNISLVSGDPLQVWIEYDGASTRLEVTVAPAGAPRPALPLVSCTVNLSSVVADVTYVGFSGANGAASSSHYVLGWSFRLGGGRAPDLDLSKLPRPPSHRPKKTIRPQLLLALILLAVVLVALLVVSAGVMLFVLWRRRFAEEKEDWAGDEEYEDWEIEYGPHRIRYKDLHAATSGFCDVIGVGGFGSVYYGVLPRSVDEEAVKEVAHDSPRQGLREFVSEITSRLRHQSLAQLLGYCRPADEVAVKKLADNSREGLREFVSEITSMSRLRHRNLVQVIGYCRWRRELILVYDYMVNSSLDKHLFDAGKPALSWERRAKIVRDVAAGLLYLHEGWEQVVVHRDIKASNVLLDADMNAKLGDFGLARLYNHGSDPRTTRIFGSFGYVAPEVIKTGKPTPSTDVFAFGALLLEVACGRRLVESVSSNNDDDPLPVGLVDHVFDCWKAGRIRDARDPRIGECDEDDLELVLKVGLLCSQSDPRCRPSMRQVVQILEGAAPVPEAPPEERRSDRIFGYYETFDEFLKISPATIEMVAVTTQTPSSRSSDDHLQIIISG